MNEKPPTKKFMPVRGRGIYLLPHLLTTASLFSGFYAVIAATNQKFEVAAIAIFIALIWDGLDGRVARLMNAQSAFGAQYDSLSDMVSFGVTPALVVYHWALYDLGKLGWLAAFVYAAGTALRLARFNLVVDTSDKRYFQGLACPAAAATIAGMVWSGQHYQVDRLHCSVVAAIVTLLVGSLMVSNFRYRSFKDLEWRHNVSFLAVLIVVLLFVIVSLSPPLVLLVGFSAYVLSGPVLTYRTTRHMKMAHVVGDSDEHFYDDEVVDPEKNHHEEQAEAQQEEAQKHQLTNDNA